MTEPVQLAEHSFRCLDDGHVLIEPRNLLGPLATRQTSWCAVHDCPAVVVTDVQQLDSAAGAA